MSYTAKEICERFNLNENDISNIYQYGSRVYGTFTEDSDWDYIVVHKKSMIDGKSFKINARTSEDGKIQIIQYSKGGFLDAINRYEMSALECLWLQPEQILKETIKFSLQRLDPVDFPKQIIIKASASWHAGISCLDEGNNLLAKKNMFHSLRILQFALQIKNNNCISDYMTLPKMFKQEVFLKDLVYDDLYNGDFKKLRDIMFESLKEKKNNSVIFNNGANIKN